MMVSFEDDIDHDAASQDERSDNDADEEMDDAVDDEADVEADADGDDGEEDDNDENDEDEDQDEADSPSQSQRQTGPGISAHTPNEQALEGSSQSQPNPIVTLTSPSPHSSNVRSPNRVNAPFRPTVRPEALTAPVYDIVPTIAAPQSTSINAVASTSDMRYVFSGGADGYVRMYNWIDTANGKTALTVQQRQPFVDSVTKHGVLQTYWENEEDSVRTPPSQSADEPTSLSPVYSLAVHHQALWLLSGLESGGINLVTCRHQAGTRISCLRKHTSAVSVLHLAPDETSFLSGSWDKMIYDWDLNTGTTKRSFARSGGQISAIEPRPISSLQVPEESGQFELVSDTFASNNALKPVPNGITVNGVKRSDRRVSKDGVDATEGAVGSPDGSLFGDNGGDGGDHDSLFGSDDAGAAGQSGAAFGDDEDDEFSRAIANGIQQSEEASAEGDVDMADAQDTGDPVQTELSNPEPAVQTEEPPQDMNGILHEDTTLSAVSAAVNSELPHSEDPTSSRAEPNGISEIPEDSSSSETTFLDASIDAVTGMSFRLSLKPKIPLESEEEKKERIAADAELGVKATSEDEDEWMDEDDEGAYNSFSIPPGHLEYRSRSRSSPPYDLLGHSSGSSSNSHDMPHSSYKHPPFDLLASMYLDGRQRPERRKIIYLDPLHPEFARKVEFNTRWMEDKNGNLRKCAWFFKDVGIETMFDKLVLSKQGEGADLAKEDEEDLLSAMNLTGLEDNGVKMQLGQIVVVLERIRLGKTAYDEDFHAEHRAEHEDSMDTSDLTTVSHTVGFDVSECTKNRRVPIIHYGPYVEGEKPYAVFRFYYRSEEKLRKFCFDGFPQCVKAAESNNGLQAVQHFRNARGLNKQLSALTPLSISNSLTSTKKDLGPPISSDSSDPKIIRSPKGSMIAFEDKIGDPSVKDVQAVKDSDDNQDLTQKEASGTEKHERRGSMRLSKEEAYNDDTPPDSPLATTTTDDESSADEKESNRPSRPLPAQLAKVVSGTMLEISMPPTAVDSSADVADILAPKPSHWKISPLKPVTASEIATPRSPVTDSDGEEADDEAENTQSTIGSKHSISHEGDGPGDNGVNANKDDDGLSSATCKVSLGKRGRDDEDEEEANADQSDIQAPRSAKSSRLRSPSYYEDNSSDRNTALVDFISLLRGERELPGIFVTPPDGGFTASYTIASTEDSDHMKMDRITEGGAAHNTEDLVVYGPAVVTKADDMEALATVGTNKHAVIDTPATSTNMDDMEGLSAFYSPLAAAVGTLATEAHAETTGGPEPDHAQAMLSADLQNVRTDAAEVSGAAETEMERV
ncbi:hypothetical protein B0A49_06223 [Cryomyces minteri]|uniref:Transcription factor spt8 beta-propeller domain-containing protein n=1 Tax=Cryomyces minteri TaxID=331657 RepID=A0A4V5NGA4_9PEZI|nr:hypothetical protein B0A49_06223 [Cryomyces minteri]